MVINFEFFLGLLKKFCKTKRCQNRREATKSARTTLKNWKTPKNEIKVGVSVVFVLYVVCTICLVSRQRVLLWLQDETGGDMDSQSQSSQSSADEGEGEVKERGRLANSPVPHHLLVSTAQGGLGEEEEEQVVILFSFMATMA